MFASPVTPTRWQCNPNGSFLMRKGRWFQSLSRIWTFSTCKISERCPPNVFPIHFEPKWRHYWAKILFCSLLFSCHWKGVQSFERPSDRGRCILHTTDPEHKVCGSVPSTHRLRWTLSGNCQWWQTNLVVQWWPTITATAGTLAFYKCLEKGHGLVKPWKLARPWQDSNLQSSDPKSDAFSIRPHGHCLCYYMYHL